MPTDPMLIVNAMTNSFQGTFGLTGLGPAFQWVVFALILTFIAIKFHFDRSAIVIIAALSGGIILYFSQNYLLFYILIIAGALVAGYGILGFFRQGEG